MWGIVQFLSSRFFFQQGYAFIISVCYIFHSMLLLCVNCWSRWLKRGIQTDYQGLYALFFSNYIIWIKLHVATQISSTFAFLTFGDFFNKVPAFCFFSWSYRLNLNVCCLVISLYLSNKLETFSGSNKRKITLFHSQLLHFSKVGHITVIFLSPWTNILPIMKNLHPEHGL